MSNKIFRQKSVERVSSPEQLNDYIKVANPGIWILLVAVAVLLIGVCVWGFVGKLDTKISVTAIAQDGILTCYVTEENLDKVEKAKSDNLPVVIDGKEYAVTSVASSPITVSESMGNLFLSKSGFTVGQYVYEVVVNASLPNDVYTLQIVVDRVSPLSFVIN